MPINHLSIQLAYEDARIRGLCEAGAHEVAAGLMREGGAANAMAHLQVKRIYDGSAEVDGARILVDRLWPRGVSKDEANITAWFKDLAPSDELRRWYDHDPQRFQQFAASYREELDRPVAAAAIDELRETVDLRRRITLLTATRCVQHSGAEVLREYLEQRL